MTADELQKVIGLIVGSSAFTGILSKVLDYYLEGRRKRREAEQEAAKPKKDGLDAPVRFAAKVTPIIYEILGNYVPEGNVNICELHNGDRFYSKRGIQRMTMTAEACIVRGQSRIKDLQNVILNADQLNWLDAMRKDRAPVYYADTSQVPAGYIRDYFEFYCIESMYVVGLFNQDDQLVGLLAVSSPEKDFLAGQPLTGITNQVQHLQTILTPESN